METDLNKRHLYLKRLLEHFWVRWSSEYLTELRERNRYTNNNYNKSAIQIGDVVLVKEDKRPRGQWKIGVV